MVLTASEWAAQQWASVKLGDRRLTRRAVEMGAKMTAHPEASLPNQMESPDATKGAYGMLNHPAVTLAKLTEPHRQQTLTAARQASVVLMVEDTTELDFTHHASKRGLGPVGNGQGQGLLLHSTLGVIPGTRQVLGIAHLEALLREPHRSKQHGWSRSPEGRVWEMSAQGVGCPPEGVLWVHVSDRASDMFEYMATCRGLNKHFLLRAQHNRKLDWEAVSPSAQASEVERMLDYARSLPADPDSAYTVLVPARDDQPAREAHLALQWAPATIPPPLNAPPPVRHHAPVSVWVLRAWEPDPPANVEPVEWILLSSLPITTLEEARERIDWYTCRWLCEDYHQCLKTGCRIERSQLDDGADIQRLLGFAAPIAVRLLQLRQTARNAPNLLASAVVEPLMVQLLAHRQKTDWQAMTIESFWRGVARLGGHQGRRRDGPPGWRTLWRGWRRLSDLTEGAQLFASLNTS
jgi:hypothetical protein